MKILIDNGHGVDTKGKHSPDRTLMEWKYTREIAAEVVKRLKSRGLDASLLVPEMADVTLAARCRRVNDECSRHGAANVCLVSIHVNASGADGEWHSAHGWSAWVCPKASAASRRLAEGLYDKARATGLHTLSPMPARKYWESGFYILRHTACPAVLTENLFQDNRDDVTFLLSSAGREHIVSLHVEAIAAFAAGK